GYGKCGYRNLVYFAACNVLCGSEGENLPATFWRFPAAARLSVTQPTSIGCRVWSPTCSSCSASTPIQTLGTILLLSSLRSKRTTGRRRLWDIRCCKPKASHRHGLIRKHRRRFRRFGNLLVI